MPSCSFSETIEVRYDDDFETYCNQPCEIFVVGSYPRSSPDGKLVLPRILTLNCCGIDRAGSIRVIEDLCHDVEELDLAQNELTDLNEIDDVIRFMPNLNFLNLSHNDMSETVSDAITRADSLRHLVLNNTHISWETATCFLDAMPNIEELHMSLNNYSSVQLTSSKEYANLKQLFLCGNPLSEWDDVFLLDRVFPCLETLVLADSGFGSVPESHSWCNAFQNLHCLNFNNAQLRDWSDVERLNNFPKLEDLRLQGIPVLEELAQREGRQHVISYLPRMKRLNGSSILQKDKEDAERAFIRYHLSVSNKPKRVQELEKIHGKLDPLIDIDLSPKKTATVEVRFCEEQLSMSVNLQLSVQELKSLLSDKFGIRPTKIRLFYVDQDLKEYCGPDELRYNTRKLYSYQIRDGDEFLVDTKF